ncbi:hypothetical protein QQS21_010647 [Conoideocrella luteorostrata]|uniref:Tubulin-tyrosine ligase n=1 Tax=Conoideocrella luteorostrata TaxID=1105319 RepID=A0AAJ0CFK1_9HYPO|nr:hypothetical protein QQS21_010647 [Conoideocrella luteorostrata]
METLEETARVITSKPAQRAAVNVALLGSSAVTLLGLASLATALFFQNFVPDQCITKPVYLQYQSGLNPYGLAQLEYPSPKLQQDYDVSVTLSMPRSPPNTERGNFMVSLYLVRGAGKGSDVAESGRHFANGQQYLENRKILFKSRRPALMPYEEPIISVAKRVLFMGYYALFPRSQRRIMTIQLAERVNFGNSAVRPSAAFVEIEAGQTIQIYETALTLTARLRGLRWLMFHYRLITYAAFTFLFWVCEVLFMCVAWVVWSFTTASKNSARKGEGFTDGEDDDGYDYDEHSDLPASSVTYGRQVAIKSEASFKMEEDDEEERRISDIPLGDAEADDEDDFDDDDDNPSRTRRNLGTGTSYKGDGGDSVRRRASRNPVD